MNQKEQQFVATVWQHHERHGRHDLPWRKTTDPYSILVSELMLQQTQVQRVIPKYEIFLETYPTAKKLAKASLGDVLRLWQGLGYNRRAKFLLLCAKQIVERYDGVFPTEYTLLLQLPGIGPYTAAAICAFSYNQPIELIETNVRQVYIHHFFKRTESVTDAQILKKVRRTLPINQSRQWYGALMDYGTYLKAIHGNNTKKTKGYTKQSKFKGSDRQLRGAILRSLAVKSATQSRLVTELDQFNSDRVATQLRALVSEELVLQQVGHYRLP